ncbi:MAG: glycine C-acetyltransferase [Candidatus Kerfeldbacteria bacterium RIFCSPHIGHO2_12_FULL_48_17]|uniref:8-amino-7-oxononanoate synthase n=1 Tax=Candidatus Kerfeldbacteria bacterium RIFCSPHIGHO2_12_FULL_48_17 TaxID=1798542 RepID=A0A1G2AZ49_9BACT|nr:MAG: glycine C-acetyltransferase [Candidatus Kerfeldbacteria bacterium RIFCSPHIGHO2_12_FULL_48_17]
MYTSLQARLKTELKAIADAGLHKEERVISSRQGRMVRVQTADGTKDLLNCCANNYLGLSGSDELVAAAREGLEKYGYGLSSVRFICGTQDVHKELERKTAAFVGMADAIVFSSAMTANMGFFSAFLGEEDTILTDASNHASIIDGIRLCKAERYIYKHMDMADLEAGLQAAQKAGRRTKCIVTDGVFSMDGDVAPLAAICDLADTYEALVVVDDSHATGFMGAEGRGTHELCGVLERVDVITSTYGKALGGACGGFIAGRQEIIDMLRERCRTYLFSNSLPPVIAHTAGFAMDYLAGHPELRAKLWENTRYFRKQMQAAGFTVPVSEHPIVPVMLGDARKTQEMARGMMAEGIYVIGFSYPVVPEGKARIRVQISSLLAREDVDRLVAAFVKLRG